MHMFYKMRSDFLCAEDDTVRGRIIARIVSDLANTKHNEATEFLSSIIHNNLYSNDIRTVCFLALLEICAIDYNYIPDLSGLSINKIINILNSSLFNLE